MYCSVPGNDQISPVVKEEETKEINNNVVKIRNSKTDMKCTKQLGQIDHKSKIGPI